MTCRRNVFDIKLENKCIADERQCNTSRKLPLNHAYVNNRTSPFFAADCQSVKKLQKLLFFGSVAVRMSISTKLCMQIEDTSAIFVTDNYYWIRSRVFALGAKNAFLGF